VDDYEENLFALEVILRDITPNLVRAQSGTEALKVLLQQDISLILMDVRMPGMDGFETAAMIRQREKLKHTPIIFVTAFDLKEEDVFRGYSLGAVDFIFKPVVPEIMRSKVGVFVDLYRKTEQIRRQSELLQNYNAELEKRVKIRTAELSQTNEQLIKEIMERKRTESQLKDSLQQKDMLLKEVHHRVKNNLQIISSLLNLQLERSGKGDAYQALRSSQDRIRTIALVHEKLYQSRDLGKINIADYLESLARSLFVSYGVDSSAVRLQMDAQPVYMDMDRAIPCGMLVYELLSNSLKYAFPKGRKGRIRLSLGTTTDQRTRLEIRDDGVGLPEGFDYRRTDSLGFQLVCRLADQLRGELHYDGANGTTFEVTFAPGGAPAPAATTSVK
jgi:two-component sensor histidine kinase/DNA-binding NarL/FixJ family response regulator